MMYMKTWISFLLFIQCVSFTHSFLGGGGVNGAKTCAACTVTVSLIQQMSVAQNKTVLECMQKVCSYFPYGTYKTACEELVVIFGPIVMDLLIQNETPDVVCHSIGFCYTEPGKDVCHLFPPPSGGFSKSIYKSKLHADNFKKKTGLFGGKLVTKICKLPVVEHVCNWLEHVYGHHMPGLDLDQDGYSPVENIRGSYWRGRDCNDLNEKVYPGRRPTGGDVEVDMNCNGIYGIDSISAMPYEDLFCQDSEPMGIAAIGDSAVAHFHIPEQWLMPKKYTSDLFTHLPLILENEVDWPMMSASTGFKNVTWPIIDGTVDSLYMKLRRRNLCNHRDYQNLAVNGARYTNVNHSLLQSIARNRTTDYPMLIVYALVGNDVCNHYPDTVAHMTTPKQLRKNVLTSLKYLNKTVPAGSKMIIMGIADGRPLFKYMHNRLHPIGKLRADVTFDRFYDYFNCLEISPCSGWMNTNKTIRELTAKRMHQLNAVLKELAKKYYKAFRNLEVNYMPCAIGTVLEQWEKTNGKGSGWQLIEPVDGFHPNQRSQTLFANAVWDHLEHKLPHYLGKVNPNNKKIQDLFGDQGGH